MQLAVNYSWQLGQLLKENVVIVDLIKCPEWAGMVNSASKFGKVTVHFEIGVGNGSVKDLDFEMIKRFLQITETPHLNVHLCGDSTLTADYKPDEIKLLDRWKSDIEYLKLQLPDQSIVAENLPYLPTHPENRISSRPGLIQELLTSQDIGFLLDLSHLRITAHYESLDFKAFASEFPLNRIEEIHLTGIKVYANYLTDHFEMGEEDFAAARWAISQIKAGNWQTPKVVAFEYGGAGDVFAWRSEISVLRNQIPQLYALVHD